jgi:polysaccharide export outer membrane protein
MRELFLRAMFPFIGCWLLITSCVSTSTVTYYRGLPDSSMMVNNLPPELAIRKNDILYISVSGKDATVIPEFNFPNVSSLQGNQGGIANAIGYLVDESGKIDFPRLGRIKADGLTKKQLSESIRTAITEWVPEGVVTVRLMNFRVTVLGEVGRPGTYTVPNERITLIEALGNAGDVTLFGRKDNVLLVRETDSLRTAVRLNLNDRKFLASPYYYLKPNDYIYVEPNNVKVNTTSPWQQSGPIIISTLSLLVVLLTSFK